MTFVKLFQTYKGKNPQIYYNLDNSSPLPRTLFLTVIIVKNSLNFVTHRYTLHIEKGNETLLLNQQQLETSYFFVSSAPSFKGTFPGSEGRLSTKGCIYHPRAPLRSNRLI